MPDSDATGRRWIITAHGVRHAALTVNGHEQTYCGQQFEDTDATAHRICPDCALVTIYATATGGPPHEGDHTP